MSLLTLLQPLALVLIVLVIVLEIRCLHYQVFHIIVTLHKADSLFAKATEEVRRQKTLLTQVCIELDDINDFLDNHRDSVEDRAPGILSEFQRIRERQGILEENQEFEHADIQRRLTQLGQRISDLRSICLRIDAELSRGTDSDDNRTL